MLKIDQILKPESAFSVGRSYQTPKSSSAEDALLAKKIKAIANGSVQQQQPKKAKVDNGSRFDAWADEAENIKSASTKSSDLLLPAVSIPIAVSSYNPSREDHLAHLEALEVTELERLVRFESFKKQSMAVDANGTDLMTVANRKLALGQHSDDEDDYNNGTDSFINGSTQMNRKKTIQERKKQLRHKEVLKGHSARRAEKQLSEAINQAPELLKIVQEINETREKADEMLVPVAEEHRKNLKRMHIKKRLALAPLSIKLPEELPSSMRLLAPEGNLISDRFRNYIERGAIEASTNKILSSELRHNYRSQSLKTKVKMVEKSSYKNFK